MGRKESEIKYGKNKKVRLDRKRERKYHKDTEPSFFYVLTCITSFRHTPMADKIKSVSTKSLAEQKDKCPVCMDLKIIF